MFRIVNLIVDNFRGIEAVDLTPQEDLVKIQGGNNAGKTSVIDSILVGLLGPRGFSDLVKKGEDQSRIELDFEDFKIIRVLKETGNPSLQVLVPEGDSYSPVKSPSEFLSSKIFPLALNPMDFVNQKAADQVTTFLEAFNIHIDDLEKEYQFLYDERRALKRDVKNLETKLAQIKSVASKHQILDKSIPDQWKKLKHSEEYGIKEAPNVKELMTKLSEYREKLERANSYLHDLEKTLPNQILRLDADIAREEKAKEERLTQIEKQIAALQAEAEELKNTDIAKDLREEKKSTEEELKKLQDYNIPEKIEKIKEKINETNALVTSSTDVTAHNAKVRALAEEVAVLEQKETELIKTQELMNANREELQNRLSDAQVAEGSISVRNGELVVDSIAFQNLSESVRLKFVLELIKAKNPDIKVIVIEAGRALDSKNMEKLKEFARENGFQIWLEEVRDTPSVNEGFFIESGKVLTEEEKATRIGLTINNTVFTSETPVYQSVDSD